MTYTKHIVLASIVLGTALLLTRRRGSDATDDATAAVADD